MNFLHLGGNDAVNDAGQKDIEFMKKWDWQSYAKAGITGQLGGQLNCPEASAP